MSTRMVALGDSIYAGVSGAGGWVSGNQRIPDMIASELGWQCDNQALSGAKLAGKDYIDFLQVVKRLNFKNYDVCLLEYGVNDFDWSWESLDDLREALDKGVAKIRSDNPNIQIFYQQPTGTWKHVDSLDKEDGNGWTQNDMARTLADECDVLGISYYEWTDPIITYANTAETQGDTIHPNPATMVKIADRLANWLGNNASGFIGMYVSSIQAIYNRINSIYKSVYEYLSEDGKYPKLNISAPSNANKLNRSVYRWTIENIEELERVMNTVINLCNTYGFINDLTGEENDNISLWIPRRLTIDQFYLEHFQNNIKLCNDVLSRLNKYINNNQ